MLGVFWLYMSFLESSHWHIWILMSLTWKSLLHLPAACPLTSKPAATYQLEMFIKVSNKYLKCSARSTLLFILTHCLLKSTLYALKQHLLITENKINKHMNSWVNCLENTFAFCSRFFPPFMRSSFPISLIMEIWQNLMNVTFSFLCMFVNFNW
jgi:hypothetical protein